MEKHHEPINDHHPIYSIGEECRIPSIKGTRTLYVKGIQKLKKIKEIMLKEKCDTLFLGDGHTIEGTVEWALFLEEVDRWHRSGDFEFNYILHVDSNDLPWLHELICMENFDCYPLISIKMPYVGLLPYNTTISIDDYRGEATNPGVWSHTLSDLTASDKYHSRKDLRSRKNGAI